jgi:glycosyltransferase involved in cell wall biosynthesis
MRQLRVVHDGVAAARARSGNRDRGRARLGLRDDELLLLTVAKLTDHKGHGYLLDAMPGVLERYPGVCLALAGDGELADSLRARARALGIERNVRFLGFRHDVPDLLHASDLFVLPSRMEGLCTSIIDAMLAGRPLVTTTAGGIPDLVIDENSPGEPLGWSVPPEDAGALTTAILEALGDGAERASRAARARQRAERMFLADHMVTGTVQVYREALRERRQVEALRLRTAA